MVSMKKIFSMLLIIRLQGPFDNKELKKWVPYWRMQGNHLK